MGFPEMSPSPEDNQVGFDLFGPIPPSFFTFLLSSPPSTLGTKTQGLSHDRQENYR